LSIYPLYNAALQCQVLYAVTDSLYLELASYVIELVYGMDHVKGKLFHVLNSTFCSLNHLNSLCLSSLLLDIIIVGVVILLLLLLL
jgi:hypothetical protein